MPLATPSGRLATGPAAAAMLGAGTGLVALGTSQVFAERCEPIKQWMQALGNGWVPGAAGIGPYSGKETVALLVWLGSWALLHLAWRRRDINLIAAGITTVLLIGLATTIVWPPITAWLAHP